MSFFSSETISNLRVGARKKLMPWQTGIITASKSMMAVFEQLQKLYPKKDDEEWRGWNGVEYVKTDRFNQVRISYKLS